MASESFMGDDEAQLLAMVGGTVEDMTQYEEQVIQKAERSAVPLLSSTTKGFHGLVQALAPSYSAVANRTGRTSSNNNNNKKNTSQTPDLAHFQSILAKTRKELAALNDESHRSQILRLKEQMILAYYFENLPNEDIPVQVAQEVAAEHRRKYQIQNYPTTEAMTTTAKKHQLSLKGDASPIDQQAEPKRQRRTMQDWKRQQETEANDVDTERRKALKQKRKERQERRRKRLAQLLGIDHDDDENVDEDEEVEFNDETKPKGTADNQELASDSVEKEADQRENSEVVALPQEQQLHVECPLCHQQVPFIDVDQQDSALSHHIDQCQNSGRRLRRRPKTYEETDSMSDDNVKDKPRRTPRWVSAKSTSASTKKATTPLLSTTSPALDDLEESAYEDRVDDWIENGLLKMKEMPERDNKEVPPGAVVYANDLHIPAWVNNRLFSYQRVGLQWLWDLHQQEAGGIVGDEMGLGKTVQVCSFLGCMAACRKLKSVLIVCPATMLRHWLKELSIWAPGLRRVLIHKSGEGDGASRNISANMLKAMNNWLKRARADRVYEPIDEQDFDENDEDSFVGTGYTFVTTYENLRRSPDLWTSHRWSYVVLDEGQKIRNPDSDITLVCKRLRTPHRLLLSGTPIQNDLKELWTLFDFVFPGRLGTLPAFETEFAEPIRRGGFSNASPMQVQLAYRCALVLKHLINPYLLRRQKKDIEEVSRMPGKTEQVLFCRLSKRQRELYEAYLRSDEVTSILRGAPQLLRSITILRKICNHPDLVCDATDAAYESFARSGFQHVSVSSDSDSDNDDGTDEYESLVERSGKLEVLAKILPLWQKQGHRVLIFCQWTKMLNILQRFMMAQGWKFGRMDGKTSVASRQNLVDTFNTDESYFALLMTTRTGGVGLNLTGADRVVIYDPDWNPQTDSQARARSHRFGQTRPVTIYRLITAGTIEEKIYHRQIFKTALTNRVLQDPKQKRLFSQRDLRDLFTLKSDDGSVIQGGQGVTELGTITKGQGVIHPEAIAGKSRGDDDNGDDDMETLETVMKSKGLAGVFDHDFVDRSDINKSLAAREMEEQAARVAAEAVKALKASTGDYRDRFQPTYTGSEETASGRFGHGAFMSRKSSGVLGRNSADSNFGGAGISARDVGTPTSSKSLLAGLKGLQSTPSSTNTDVDVTTTGSYAVLLNRIRAYLQRCGGYREGGGPTTDEVLKEFDDVPPNDAAIFRRLLKSVAKVERGRWRLTT